MLSRYEIPRKLGMTKKARIPRKLGMTKKARIPRKLGMTKKAGMKKKAGLAMKTGSTAHLRVCQFIIHHSAFIVPARAASACPRC